MSQTTPRATAPAQYATIASVKSANAWVILANRQKLAKPSSVEQALGAR